MLVLITGIPILVAFALVKWYLHRSHQVMFAVFQNVFHRRKSPVLNLTGIREIKQKTPFEIVQTFNHSQLSKRFHRPVQIKVFAYIFNFFRRKKR